MDEHFKDIRNDPHAPSARWKKELLRWPQVAFPQVTRVSILPLLQSRELIWSSYVPGWWSPGLGDPLPCNKHYIPRDPECSGRRLTGHPGIYMTSVSAITLLSEDEADKIIITVVPP